MTERIRDDLPEARPIIQEIDAITKRGEERHRNTGPDIRSITHPGDYLEPAERERLYDLKMRLRSKSREEARADILKRRGIRSAQTIP